ncbi:MAG: MFS transporter [Haloferacaceae archaeon]
MPLESLLGEEADILTERDFQAMLVANLLAPLGIPLVSPLLNALTGAFGVSSARVGLLISAYTAPPIFLIPVAGVLADRYGRKPLLLGGLLLFGVAGTSIAFTTDFRVAVALRLLQGVAFAGLTPMIITSLGDLYAGAREATAQGLRFTTSGIYQSVFPAIAGVLVGVGWQYPFLLYALAFPAAAVVYRWFDEPLDAAGPDADADPEAAADGGEGAGSQLRALVRLALRRRVLALVVGRMLPMIAWVGFLTYNSFLVIQSIGGSAAQSGLLVTINSVMLAVGGSQAGRITSRFDSRLWPLVAANVGLGGGLALIGLAPSLPVAAFGTVLLGTGFGVSLSLYRSLITGLAPASLRGSLVSLAESGGRVGSTITPLGMGAVVTLLAAGAGEVAAVRLTTAVVGAFVLVGGQVCLVVARLSPRTPAERERRGERGAA